MTEIADVAHLDVVDQRHAAIAHFGPQRARHVNAARGRAFLPLVFIAAAHDGDRQSLGLRGGMGQDKVLTTGFAYQPGIRAVRRDVLSHRPPHALEHGRAAREIDPRQLRVGQQRRGDGRAVARDEIDDARRQSRSLEQPQRVVRTWNRRRGRLPDHCVAHQRRGDRQVGADRREIERRYGEHEAFQSAIIRLVPHAVVREWLILVELLGEVGVETARNRCSRRRRRSRPRGSSSTVPA